jgi:serine protease Do
MVSTSEQRPKSFLGIGVREVDSTLAKERQLTEERGVEVTRVSENSAAAEAGLLKGDIILEFSGQPVQGVEQFMRLVRETPVGRSVSLKISRDGKVQTLTAKMGACEKCGAAFTWARGKDFGEFMKELPIPPNPPNVWFPDTPQVFTTWRSTKLGIDAESLEGQLADFFGVKEGVLVRGVTPGSAAEKAGLRAGDVITKVGGTTVSKPRDISRAMRDSNSATLPFTVIRDKRETSVTVDVDRDPSGDGGIQRLISEDSGMRL